MEENKYYFAREIIFSLRSSHAISNEVYIHWLDKLNVMEENHNKMNSETQKNELHGLIDKMSLDQIKDILSYAGYLYRIKLSNEIEGGIDLRDTNMNARARNICKNCEVFTIEQLSTYTVKEVLRWRNMGESTIKAMREEMQKYGFDFAYK